MEEQLQNEFENGLYQGGVSPGMVPGLAQVLAHNIVRGICLVLSQYGDSLLVYFVCDSIRPLQELARMVKSGFMQDVFTAILEPELHLPTTVDIYVRLDEFRSKRKYLSYAPGKGLRQSGPSRE